MACVGRSAWGLEFPGPEPGEAKAKIDAASLVLENRVLSFTWLTSGGQLRPATVTDKLSGVTLPLERTECFQIVLAQTPLPGQRLVKASELKIVGQPQLEALKPNERRARLSERNGFS